MASDLELPVVLPQSVVLKNKNNAKYLRYTDEDSEQHGLLQFTEQEATSPKSKFQVEPSKTAKGLVHLRCVYNNKYLVRSDPDRFWISAAASGPEDDRSKWTCTLFNPILAEDVKDGGGGDATTFVRFLHVQLNRYACLFSDSGPYGNFMYAGWEEPQANLMDVCEVVDWESLLVLPQKIAFKGDNGLYLRAVPLMADLHVLQFLGKDIGDPNVGFQVLPTPEGAIQIRSNITGSFWRWSDQLDSNFIGLGPESQPSSLFWPVKVDSNIIALRSKASGNNFCRRQTVFGMVDAMAASVSTISREARIQVEELVISREIYNVEFRLLDARIYDQTIVVAATGEASNNSPNAVTNTLTLTHTETTSSSWEGSVGLKLGVKTTIKAGVPLIAEATVEISAEFSGSYTWGETVTTSNEIKNEYVAQVSPYSKMGVSLLETKGSCDVPFSYTVTDLLYDGRRVTYRKDDGIYVGANSYHYHFQTKEDPLPPSLSDLSVD